GKTGEDWIPITMAVVINWAADVINNGGYISYYGTGEDPDDADLTTDYSSLYQHTGAGGRTTNNPVDIPDGSVDASINMSWLKEADYFYVNSKGVDTVTDPIKNYGVNDYQGYLFGTVDWSADPPAFTKYATITSHIADTLTLDFTGTGKTMDNITANGGALSSFNIYTDAPQRTNFVKKCPVKNKAQITMANIKAIRQDIEIIEFAFFEDMFNKTSDTDFQIANATKKASLDALVSHIGGMLNSDGDPITTAQKKALGGPQCFYLVCYCLGWKWLRAYVQRYPFPPGHNKWFAIPAKFRIMRIHALKSQPLWETACQKRAYTKGASAEPSLRIIRADKSTSMMMIGASQYFFLYFKNSQNSAKMPNLLISLSYA
ncbi:MAG: hypothetical protein JRI58_13710, partial [Deltaproteobacteria bacterium]|nr:hypothetical protein [Deltaproteobacteria bacterium]